MAPTLILRSYALSGLHTAIAQLAEALSRMTDRSSNARTCPGTSPVYGSTGSPTRVNSRTGARRVQERSLGSLTASLSHCDWYRVAHDVAPVDRPRPLTGLRPHALFLFSCIRLVLARR